MPILTTKHSIDVCNSFIDDVKTSNNAYYVFFGRINPWDDDNSPESANDSISQTEQQIYPNLIFGKRISNNDIHAVIPNYSWSNNTPYAKYDQSDANLYSKQFYVINDNYDVFKVIDNNGGSNSTVKPTLVSTIGNFETSDGYIWKYMYSIDSTANNKFTSNSYIPVITNNHVSSNSIPGTIDSINIINVGSNYQYNTGLLENFVNSYSVQISNTASAEDNYYVNNSIYLNPGFGSGQIRNISEYIGINNRVIVDTPFIFYTKMDLTELQGIITTNEEAYQVIDDLNIIYNKGSFNANDIIVQSNTAAVGVVLSVNSTSLKILRTSSAEFANNFVIKTSIDDGNKKPGKVSVVANSSYINAVALSFNSNTAVDSANDCINLSPQYFANGDYVYYKVNSGNTAVTGLTANSNYFVVQANSSSIKLSSTYGGSALAINATSISETGHSIHQILNYYYAVNDYVRVGSNANNNIRRITAVNTSVITTDLPIYSTLTTVNSYSLSTGSVVAGITINRANGSVSNVNVNGMKLSISNSLFVGEKFIVGEKVLMVDSSNNSQSANGIIAFSNTTQLILSSVQGIWNSSYFVRGESSLQKAQIDSVVSYPNIVIESPSGSFQIGQSIFFKTGEVVSGNAKIVGISTIPNALTEYHIGPRINITGDGSNAYAYAIVNTDVGSSNSIHKIYMIDNGSNYSYANIVIESNSYFGNGAIVTPSISPINGHGYDAVEELGGNYAAITVDVNTLENELIAFPANGQYRTIGIIKNPYYHDVTINLTEFDRKSITITSTNGAFSEGEIIINAANTTSGLYSNASGICVFSNTTYLELKNVKGVFSNTTNTINKFYGVSSGAFATPVDFEDKLFSIGEILSNNGSAYISNVVTNTQILVTNAYGLLRGNNVIWQETTNAYAKIESIVINEKDVTSIFGNKFNQLMRITLESNTGSFEALELVEQVNTTVNAIASVFSTTLDLDLEIAIVGSNEFANGQTIVNANNNSTAKILSCNSTYLKLTNVSNSNAFVTGNYINNQLNANASIANVYSVLLMYNVHGDDNFQIGDLSIIGSNSAAEGKISLIDFPNLKRNSGKVLYLENVEPINKTANTQEQIKIVTKF